MPGSSIAVLLKIVSAAGQNSIVCVPSSNNLLFPFDLFYERLDICPFELFSVQLRVCPFEWFH